MTEYSRFFDSTTYTEAQWNEYHRALVAHNGYVAGKANELAVTQSTPAAMTVEVDTGEALVQGAWYQNSASKTMTIEAADASYNRIDRIVTRLSFTANSIILAVLKGTAAASPAAPTLTQNATTWELSIAQIAVAAAAASIVTANITDQRLTSACGVAACNLGEMYIDNDGTLVTSGKAIIMGTGKITGLGDPTSDQDADTKIARDAAITAALAAVDTLPDPTGKGGYELIANSGGTGYELATRHYFVLAAASNASKYAIATEYSVTGTTYATVISFGIPSNHVNGGTYRLTCNIKTSNVANAAYARFYVNGIPVGTGFSTGSGTYTAKTEDVTIKCGGGFAEIKLSSSDAGATAYIKDFVFSCDETLTVPAW